MGHVHVDARVSWKGSARARMLVDTGATHTVLPEDLVRKLGVTRSPRRVRVRLAHGVLLVGVRTPAPPLRSRR